MVEIKLDDELLKSVVSEAILTSLDQKKRDALVIGAIQALLTPKKDGYYGRNTTPIEDAFNEGVRYVAVKIAQDYMEKDDAVAAQIRSMLQAALVKVMETNREATIAKLANAIAAGLAYRERD